MASERQRTGWRWRVAGACLAFWLVLLAACQSTTRVGDRYYASGRYAEAAAAYRVYLDAGQSDKDLTARTLYRLAVIYATPGTEAYDPARSLEALDTLISVYPGSIYTPEAILLRDLQRTHGELETEIEADKSRLDALQLMVAERQSRLDSLEDQLADRDAQIVALQESIPPLQLEIRDLIRQLATKQQELEQLERLKAIDLDQPPP